MAATNLSSNVTDQCDTFLSKVQAQLACYMEEATMLVSRLGEQEVCGENRDKIRGIKKKELQRFIELGNDLQMESKKLFNKKCNFYNRGFCNKGNQCVFLHPLRLCGSIFEGNICEDAQCEDRHPFECRKYRTTN